MKILGLHRGFTTNSSASSEWVSPKSMFKSGSFDKDGNFIPNEGFAPPGERQQEAAATSSQASSTPGSSNTRPNVFADNAMMLLAFVAAVLGLFATERFVRRMIKKAREKNSK